MENIGFTIYLLFTISWFLHLTARIQALGVIHIDAILIFLLVCFSFAVPKRKNSAIGSNATSNYLKYLIIFAVVTVPLVEWPGSVIRFGLENYIKAVVFFYFTVSFVNSTEKLKKFLLVFLGCQVLRVAEPVYLHVTEGYWGSVATMAGWEYMDRLSGAPSDIVNPNGLAFIILTIMPFLHFQARLGKMYKVMYLAVMPLLLYALVLTGSRSGFVGLLIIVAGIIYKSKNRIVMILAFGIVGLILAGNLSDTQKDRYLSIIESDKKNSVTAEGRLSGVENDLTVALRRPLFGHGLGTSREANANFGNDDKPSHNLYTEVAQELGFLGLILFLLFMKSIVNNFITSKRLVSKLNKNKYLDNMLDAMQIWLIMNIIFSFASYGLSSYEWYLFAGLSVVTTTIIVNSPDLRENAYA